MIWPDLIFFHTDQGEEISHPEITICKSKLLWTLGSIYPCYLTNVDNFKEAFKNCINDSDETVNLKSLNVGYEDLGKTTRKNRPLDYCFFYFHLLHKKI